MKHVFVETNYLIDLLRPFPTPEAEALLGRHGVDVTLHAPWCAFTEARRTLEEVGSQELAFVDGAGRFLRRLGAEARSTPDMDREVRAFIDLGRARRREFLQNNLTDLDSLRRRIAVIEPSQLSAGRTIDIFRKKQLPPFDEMMLGCIVSEAEQLFRTGARELFFCDKNTKDFKPTSGNELGILYHSVGLTYLDTFDVP